MMSLSLNKHDLRMSSEERIAAASLEQSLVYCFCFHDYFSGRMVVVAVKPEKDGSCSWV